MSTDTRYGGSIPELYDRHLGPVLFEPYAQDLAQRIPLSARRIVEVAAGSGRLTRHVLARLPPDGELLVTDLTEVMLEFARQRTINDPRVQWHQADMSALPLPDASVEAVVGSFGLMFAADPIAALREMRRVLTSGGIVLLSVWANLDENPASQCFQQLCEQAFPGDPPPFATRPFSLGDAHEVERLATEAGLRGVRVETIRKTGEAETAASLAAGYVRGNPFINFLTERGIDASAFEAKVASEVGRRFGDKPCRMPLAAHVLTAFA